MSAAESDTIMMFCASCGTAGSNDIKLKRCNACYLVRYCSVKCQKDHRPKHKKECKKRAADLKDEILFKQPESSCYGDCPICCLPLSIDPSKSRLMGCCSKLICNGCNWANMKRETEERLRHTCPFCRTSMPKTEEFHQQLMKRIEANDPVAMGQMGKKRCEEGDYTAAFEYFAKAATLGDAASHYQLSTMYHIGMGVEKDEKKYLHHTEQAAIGGHPHARHNLGCMEGMNGRFDRALKHFIIAVKLGHDKSLDGAKGLYEAGLVSKDVFTAARRDHKAVIEATKSPQREEADAASMFNVKGRCSV